MNIVRMIALGLLGLAAIASAQVVAQQSGDATGQQSTANDPLASELNRCRQLNEKAEDDPRCQAAYAENKRRFFTPPGAYVPGKVDLFPNKQRWTTDQKPPSAAVEK